MLKEIMGFPQKYALSLHKKVIRKGKEHEIRIDCTDLMILRWFVDFYPSMEKKRVEGREFAWVSYSEVLEWLPILDISKEGCASRFRKLEEFGILEFYLLKQGGTFALYTFGPEYTNLVNAPWSE